MARDRSKKHPLERPRIVFAYGLPRVFPLCSLYRQTGSICNHSRKSVMAAINILTLNIETVIFQKEKKINIVQ